MTYDHDAYLRRVRRRAEQALVQTDMLRRCQRHHNSLFRTGVIGSEERAVKLANIWMRDDGGHLHTLSDLRDAVAAIIADAEAECPMCAQGEGA